MLRNIHIYNFILYRLNWLLSVVEVWVFSAWHVVKTKEEEKKKKKKKKQKSRLLLIIIIVNRLKVLLYIL